MAYKIVYDHADKKYGVFEQVTSHFPFYLSVALVCFIVLTYLLWPEGKAALQDIIIPGEDTITLQALENMKLNLQSGIGLADAVAALCREIIYGT